MRILVTGVAGFVGYHLASRLLRNGEEVLGFDNLNAYYDAQLKLDRLAQVNAHDAFTFVKGDLEDTEALSKAAQNFKPEIIIHLAAQAGVRYALEAPRQYVSSNLVGLFNVLEVAKNLPPRHLMIASSSSVYGGNSVQPYAETHRADHPVSFYAATKKAGEDLSHSYSHLHGIPTTCFRFFTVYGPWGRPDMALFKFVDLIRHGQPIQVYGQGKMKRDFTYIDDLIEGIARLLPQIPEQGSPVAGAADSLSPVAPWRTVNISGGSPVGLESFIEILEQKLGLQADKLYVDGPAGDVPETFADPSLLEALTGYRPDTPLDVGVSKFVDWYSSYESEGVPA